MQQAPKKSRKRFFILAAGLAVLLAAGYSGYWFWAADKLSAGLANWRQQQQNRGYEISYGEPEITGFPGKAGAVFQDPKISAPSGWHYRGPALTARAEPWQPTQIEVELAGLHHFARPKGQPRVIEVEVAEGLSLVQLNSNGRLDQVNLDASDVILALPEADFTADLVKAKFGPLRGAANGTPEQLEFGLALAALILPEGSDAVLGREVQLLEIDATLHGHLSAGDQREALAAWRDTGGHLEIHHLAFTWGPLSARGRGKMTLDERFRPSGEIEAKFQGLEPTVKHLRAANQIDGEQAKMARGIIKLLAGGDQQADPPVSLPLQFNQGRVFLGPLPVARLSPIL